VSQEDRAPAPLCSWTSAWRGGFLLVLCLELVCKREFGSLFLQLGKLVLVLGHLLESGLDELALHVGD